MKITPSKIASNNIKYFGATNLVSERLCTIKTWRLKKDTDEENRTVPHAHGWVDSMLSPSKSQHNLS